MNFTFEPYVGCYYGKPESLFNKKILVVGASHYHYCEKCMRKHVISADDQPIKTKRGAHLSCNCGTPEREFTREVVESYLDRESKPGYTKFINAILIDKYPGNCKDFFDSVCFYNYLQEIEGANPQDSHPEKFSDEKHICLFKKLLSEYCPEVVLIWGAHVWNAIPEELEANLPHQKVDDSGITMKNSIWNYRFESRTIRFCACIHPSSPTFKKFEHHEMFDLCGIKVK